jgi:hypothetical protein
VPRQVAPLIAAEREFSNDWAVKLGEGRIMPSAIRILALATALMSWPVLADTDLGSAGWLLETCTSKGKAENAFCTGYVKGVVDGLGSQRVFCTEGVILQRLIDEVVKYLQREPMGAQFQYVPRCEHGIVGYVPVQ